MPDGVKPELDEGNQSSPSDDGDLEVGEDDYINAMDTACCECDDGGIVLPCDGNCMRCFHIGLDNSSVDEDIHEFSEDRCNPLQLPEELARRLKACLLQSDDKSRCFVCPNCSANIHQCFKCNLEGSSNPDSPFCADTVHRCCVFGCGRYYHPRCIGKFSGDTHTTKFVCPQHVCALKAEKTCKYMNDDEEPLIPCRRCPAALHEGCISRRMMRTREKASGKRVWLAKGRDDQGGFLGDPVDRSLIYCFEHKIPRGKENPPLQAPLFMPELLSSWRQKICLQNIDLESSKEWLIAHKDLPVKADYSSYTSYVPYARLKSKPSHKKRKSADIEDGAKASARETPAPETNENQVEGANENEAEEERGTEGDKEQQVDKPREQFGTANPAALKSWQQVVKGVISTTNTEKEEDKGRGKAVPEPQKARSQKIRPETRSSSRALTVSDGGPRGENKQGKSKRASKPTADKKLRRGMGTREGSIASILPQRSSAATNSAGMLDKAGQPDYKSDRQARLDLLYEAFQAGYEELETQPSSNPAYATLQRDSLSQIVDYLTLYCDLGKESNVIDLGSGLCRVLWHMSISANVSIAAGLDHEERWHTDAETFNEFVSQYLEEKGLTEQFPHRAAEAENQPPSAVLEGLGFKNLKWLAKFEQLKVDGIAGDRVAYIFEKSRK